MLELTKDDPQIGANPDFVIGYEFVARFLQLHLPYKKKSVVIDRHIAEWKARNRKGSAAGTLSKSSRK